MEDSALLAVAFYCGVAAIFVCIFTAIALLTEFIGIESARQTLVIVVSIIVASGLCIWTARREK